MNRPEVVGLETGPEPPYPIKINGPIVKGFGRGSKELGIPTANIPISGLDIGGYTDIESGVYYGWAGLSFGTATDDASEAPNSTDSIQQQAPVVERSSLQSSDTGVYPMVMSIGWNPFYKNEKRSVEVHIIHKFENDFYNALMNLSILGFIRHEKDYDSLDALVKDIRKDIDIAERSVQRHAYRQYAQDPYMTAFDWARNEEKC